MDLGRLLTHITYRIEPKPEGGFIARPSNPSAPQLEASTREELRQKIRVNMRNALVTEIPRLRVPLENKTRSDASALDNSPITPEAGNWTFFRLLLALLAIALLMYLFLHHR